MTEFSGIPAYTPYIISGGTSGGWLILAGINAFLSLLVSDANAATGIDPLGNLTKNMPCVLAFLDLMAAVICFVIAVSVFLDLVLVLLFTIPVGGLAVLLLALEVTMAIMIIIIAGILINHYLNEFDKHIAECKGET